MYADSDNEHMFCWLHNTVADSALEVAYDRVG